MIKHILLICSLIPLTFQGKYLFTSWVNSRLDHWNWIFYLLATLAIIFTYKKEKIGKYDYKALPLAIVMLILSFSVYFHKINALSVASSIAFIFTYSWFIASWSFASNLLPVIAILALGIPSSTYVISVLLMCPIWMSWTIKFILAILSFGWLTYINYFNVQLKKGTLFFIIATIFSSFLLLHSKEIYFEGKSFIPNFSTYVGKFLGRKIQPDDNTKRFFATSSIQQMRYTKNDLDISVLAVKCGKNIHEIHPASHCLRTSLWTILSEKILYLQDNFAVTEIEAKKGKNYCLLWVWYSNEKFSTPSFIGFRRHYKSGVNYYTYQVSIPVYKNVEHSRIELQNFIHSLNQSTYQAIRKMDK